MGDQTHWLFSPDSVMNSDPHLNSIKKEEDESFLDDLDLQEEDMSFSDFTFNMNMPDYSDISGERLLGMSEEELTGVFANQDIPQLQQQNLSLQQQQQPVQFLQQQQTLQQVPDVCVVTQGQQQQQQQQQQQPQQLQQVVMQPKTIQSGSGINVSSELTNLVALLLGNQQQQQQQATSNNVLAPVTQQVVTTPQLVTTPQVVTACAPPMVSTPQVVATPQVVSNAAQVRPATASEVIQQLVQKEQQKQLQSKTLAQLAMILQLQQQQQQTQQQQQPQVLMPTLQTTTQQQPQPQQQLQQQKPAVLQQQATVQPKVFPVSVQRPAVSSVQVIKKESVKPVVTTVPQLVIQTSQNGSVAIVGSTIASTTGSSADTTTTTTNSMLSKIPIAPLSSSPNSNGFQMVKKPEKRKAHNAIEQRYRRSINGRIEDMKQMLFKENKKVSKSHTLQKAIDHLLGLRKMVQSLKQENLNLKTELDKYKGTTTAVPDVKDPLTPPSSFTGSPDHSCGEYSDPDSPYSTNLDSPGDMDMSPPSPVRSAGPAGLLDRTRLVLCVFMFSILAFNPFGFLINKGFDGLVGGSSAGIGHADGMSGGGRKLMDVGTEGAASLIWQLIPTLLIWLVNGAIIATVLVTILYGDKTSKSLSVNSTAYWRFRTQAQLEISRGNIAQALNQLFHCFGVLGRNHPLTSVEYYASFIWNLICLPLNVVFKGRGIWARSSRQKDKQSNGKYAVSEVLAKDIALTYHQILQLFLTGNFYLGVPRAFYMGLCSINHAERARTAMSPTQLAEIYATVGVLIKTRFSKNLQWLACPVFFRVRRLLTKSKNPTPPVLAWTLAAFSRHFKLDMTVLTSWQGPSLFTSITEKRNPLVVVSQHLREKTIHNILKGILTQKPEEEGDGAQKQGKSDSENQDFLMLLNCLNISLEEATNFYQSSINASSNLQARNDYDPLARWWVNLLFVAAYWQMGEEEKAEEYFAYIDSLPPELEKEGFPLAALQAYKARHALLSASQHDVPEECLRMLNLASDNLVRSMDGCHSEENSESIMLVQLLVVDWLLSTRSAIWQKRQGAPTATPASKAELAAFQQDLTSLRKLASDFSHVGSKVTLYEAVARLMAGANPVRTQVLLDRNLRKRVTDPKQKDCDEAPTTERDRAQSLLVKSCYLYSTMPSDQVERKNLLNDAVRSLEKVGDRRGMQSCQQMLQSLQKSGSSQTSNTTVTTACC